MNAGVVKSRYKKTDLDKAIKEYKEQALPSISSHEGGRSAMLLVNRETRDFLSIGIYENEPAAKSFGAKAEKLIAALETLAAGGVHPAREPSAHALSPQKAARAVGEPGEEA